jgi:hypothetical protein
LVVTTSDSPEQHPGSVYSGSQVIGFAQSMPAAKQPDALRWLEQHPWVALPFLAVPAILPFLTFGIPGSADGTIHLLRLATLDHALRNGTWYPRWMPTLAVGYGYP